MEDKLLKILKIKIDAINRNIDNLNYLNGELDKNNASLDYIDNKIFLFKDNDVLKFEEISKEDFEKILSMVNSDVAEIFKDKTCNYEGIIYIIEGIRKSISLQLTSEQTNAILAFIEGMKEKRENLLETINNLTESKTRLPETDLTVLTNNLNVYNNMVSKFENTLYLTEIDELNEALNYAGVDVSEKSDVFEYVLKYNANIYSIKENNEFSNVSIENNKFDFETPEFNYDEVEVTNDLTKEEDTEIDNSLDEIKFNLDNLQVDDEVENENKDIEVTVPNTNNFNMDYDVPKYNFDFSESETKEEDNHELNTVELNDIIKKIDDKLKEMETQDEVEVETEIDNEVDSEIDNEVEPVEEKVSNIEIPEVPVTNNYEPTFEIPNVPVEEPTKVNEVEPLVPTIETYSSNELQNETTINDLINKYSIPELNLTNNLGDVDAMLKVINDNNLLELFKNNKNVFEAMLNNYNSSDLEELFNLIKDNLVVKEKELNSTFETLLEVMPILFTNHEVFNSFRENIKFFKEKNINIINLFDNYREMLIMNNVILTNNYNKLSGYGFDVNNDNVKYFLYNKNVLEKLDYYIEALGYEKGFLGKEEHFNGVEYITKNPYKLNNASRDMLLKLRYASENGIKIYGNKPGILAGEITNPKVDIINLTPEYLNSYFNGDYTFVDKGSLITLKNELNNLDNFDMTVDSNISKLDSAYKKDDLKYQFDNNTISRIKTIRIYNYLKNKLSEKDALIVALTYNSVLKNEEYEKIVNAVNNLLGGM